jgi:hypothetical protein
MIITQERLLQASVHYNLNIDAVEKDVNKRKPVLHILHSPEDFRLVEGMIMLLNSAHIGAHFQWNSGYNLPLLQSNIAVSEKDQIVLSKAVIFLATFKSMENKELLNNLQFSTTIGKRVYILPTSYNSIIYGESLYPQYPLLLIEKENRGNGLNLKIKKPEQKNFLHTISSVGML